MTAAGLAAIVPMQVGDIPQVMAIEWAARLEPRSEVAYRFELEANPSAYYIVALEPGAEAGRGVVGFANLQLEAETAELVAGAVHPDWRGRGVGGQLLLDLMAHARSRGALRATLDVRPDNAAALGLYRKHGFTPAGRRPAYYPDGADALCMVATLQPGRGPAPA